MVGARMQQHMAFLLLMALKSVFLAAGPVGRAPPLAALARHSQGTGHPYVACSAACGMACGCCKCKWQEERQPDTPFIEPSLVVQLQPSRVQLEAQCAWRTWRHPA